MTGRLYSDSERIRHYRAPSGRHYPRGKHAEVEVRYDDEQESSDQERWTVDEICSTQIHLEMMDEDTCWMDVNGLHVWLKAVRVKGQRKLRLIVTCFPNEAAAFVVTPGTSDSGH